MHSIDYSLHPIAFVRSSLKDRSEAPRQGSEGAPDAFVEVDPRVREALKGIEPGDDLLLITWFHQADRETLQTHPRNDVSRPMTGVFATRSPDRPNPLGLHRVKVLEITENGLKVGPLEAIDGTPVVDIKPALSDTER